MIGTCFWIVWAGPTTLETSAMRRSWLILCLEQLKKNSAYYAIGHFSRVIRAGAVRIGADSDEVVATAVQNPDGSRACVLLNDASTPCGVQIVCGEVSTRVIWMEPYSLASCVFTV